MARSRRVLFITFIVCLVLAVLGGLVWMNMRYVRSHPINKDFLIPWLGLRTFLQYGDSPYSDAATQRAQIVYYGRLAPTGQDPLIDWLPLPVNLLYFPFALVPDYKLSSALWMTFLEITLLVSGYLSLRLINWKPGIIFQPLIILFPALWVYGVFCLTSGNASGFIVLAIVGFLTALNSEQDELAGGVLVFVMCSMRITGILSLFLFWWIINHRRWRIFWGFLMSLTILLGLSFLLLPGWIFAFLRGAYSHFLYNSNLSSVRIFASWWPVVGVRLGWLLAGSLILMLFFAWRTTIKEDFRRLLWAVGLTLAVTPLLGLPITASECSFLYIPLILFIEILAEQNSWLKQWGAAGIMLMFMLVGLWLLDLQLNRIKQFNLLADILLLLLPILLAIGLSWMRWRFVHSTSLRLTKSL